jgi:hypothetical protein
VISWNMYVLVGLALFALAVAAAVRARLVPAEPRLRAG